MKLEQTSSFEKEQYEVIYIMKWVVHVVESIVSELAFSIHRSNERSNRWTLYSELVADYIVVFSRTIQRLYRRWRPSLTFVSHSNN